jgi:hypothetical protein
MTGFEGDRRWRVPLVSVTVSRSGADEVPDEWVAGLAAVSRDLRCRRYGRAVSFEGVEWELTVSSQGWVCIGMATLQMTPIWADFQSVGATHSRRRLRRRWCGLPQQFKTNWLATSSCSGLRTVGGCLLLNSGTVMQSGSTRHPTMSYRKSVRCAWLLNIANGRQRLHIASSGCPGFVLLGDYQGDNAHRCDHGEH